MVVDVVVVPVGEGAEVEVVVVDVVVVPVGEGVLGSSCCLWPRWAL